MRIKCNQWIEFAYALPMPARGCLAAPLLHISTNFLHCSLRFFFFFFSFLFNFFSVSFIHLRFEHRRAFHFHFVFPLFKIQVSRVATMLSHSRRKAVILLTSKMVNANYLRKKKDNRIFDSSTHPVYARPRPPETSEVISFVMHASGLNIKIRRSTM